MKHIFDRICNGLYNLLYAPVPAWVCGMLFFFMFAFLCCTMRLVGIV